MFLINVVFVGFEMFTAVIMKSSIFWDITPYSPLKVNRRFGRTHCLPPVTLVSCLAYSIVKMEATCSFVTSSGFQRTARRYIPQDRTLQCSRYVHRNYFFAIFCVLDSVMMLIIATVFC
jgi:hypothetical protein